MFVYLSLSLSFVSEGLRQGQVSSTRLLICWNQNHPRHGGNPLSTFEIQVHSRDLTTRIITYTRQTTQSPFLPSTSKRKHKQKIDNASPLPKPLSPNAARHDDTDPLVEIFHFIPGAFEKPQGSLREADDRSAAEVAYDRLMRLLWGSCMRGGNVALRRDVDINTGGLSL